MCVCALHDEHVEGALVLCVCVCFLGRACGRRVGPVFVCVLLSTRECTARCSLACACALYDDSVERALVGGVVV